MGDGPRPHAAGPDRACNSFIGVGDGGSRSVGQRELAASLEGGTGKVVAKHKFSK